MGPYLDQYGNFNPLQHMLAQGAGFGPAPGAGAGIASGGEVPPYMQQPQGLWDQLTGAGSSAGIAGSPLFQMGLATLQGASEGMPFGAGLPRGMQAAQRAQVVARGQDMQDFQTRMALQSAAEKAEQEARLAALRQKTFGPGGTGAQIAGPFAELASADPGIADAIIGEQVKAKFRAPPKEANIRALVRATGRDPDSPEGQAYAEQLNARAGTQIFVGAAPPGKLSVRALTPDEAPAVGIPAENAGQYIVDAKGNIELRPGLAPELAAKRKQSELARQFDPALDAVDRLEALVSQHGTEGMGPFSDQQVVGEMGPLYQQVISALGLLSKSGTIQPSEVERFATSLPDPTSFASAISMGSVDRLLGGLKTLRRSLETARDAFKTIEGPDTEKAPEGAFDFDAMTVDQLLGIGDETIATFTDSQADAYADRLEALMREQ